ncbi:hypothetical protein JCM15765_33400 [Paradesulfitobacterium aromaticivorans]
MKKVKILTGLSIATLSVALLIGYSNVALSDSKYSETEYADQKRVINTFDLNTKDYKPLSIREVYDNNIATESSEIRGKIAYAIHILTQDEDLKVGDSKPTIFLEGNDKVSIGIKHPDGTITLTQFDISKEKPEKIAKRIKEAKK